MRRAAPRPPVITAELVRRLEAAAADNVEVVLTHMQAQPGNPRSAEIHRFGRGAARAFVLRNTRFLPWANNVRGLTEDEADDVPAIAALYRASRLSYRVDVGAADLTPKLALALHTARLVAFGHNVTLFGLAHDAPKALAPGLTLEAVDSPERVAAYSDVYLRGFDLGAQREKRWEEVIERHANPALLLTLARADGVPAGIGGLSISRGVGYLGPATTLAGHRGQGIQTALIAHRVAQAHALGCEYVVATASFASPSQHNLERAGFRVLQTKSLWRPHATKAATRANPS